MAGGALHKRLAPDADAPPLTVQPLVGWRREQLWEQTGLPWLPPSPNLPTVSGRNRTRSPGARPARRVPAPPMAVVKPPKSPQIGRVSSV